MAHVVVERRKDISLQCTGKYKLFHSATLLVMHAAMQDPVFDEETSILLEEGSLLSALWPRFHGPRCEEWTDGADLTLSWHSRSLAADRLGDIAGQPTGSLAGVAADRLVFSGAGGS